MPNLRAFLAHRGHRALFPVAAVLASTALGLVIAEYGLRYYASHVRSVETMDPGFLISDPELGWEMARNWSGRHRHYDFDVRYTTNAAGLRGAWPEPGFSRRRRYAIVGDSFTFGLGVDDDETFAALLNDRDPLTDYLNAGIAGYSTDQQYLYIKRHLPDWGLDSMALVVYLGNDVLDNTLTYPLQANMGKPLFVLGSGGIALTNVPVPLETKPETESARTMASMILGDAAARQLTGWRQWQLARILGLDLPGGDAEIRALGERMAYPMDLFVGLVAEIRDLCADNGVELRLILLPGRSYVENPESLSAAFQDYVRQAIRTRGSELRVPVIDLAGQLRDRYEADGTRMFHPNEGHLTAAGHAAVADILEAELG